MTDGGNTLDYAPPRRRRRWWVLGVLLVVAAAGWLLPWGEVYERVEYRVARWQQHRAGVAQAEADWAAGTAVRYACPYDKPPGMAYHLRLDPATSLPVVYEQVKYQRPSPPQPLYSSFIPPPPAPLGRDGFHAGYNGRVAELIARDGPPPNARPDLAEVFATKQQVRELADRLHVTATWRPATAAESATLPRIGYDAVDAAEPAGLPGVVVLRTRERDFREIYWFTLAAGGHVVATDDYRPVRTDEDVTPPRAPEAR